MRRTRLIVTLCLTLCVACQKRVAVSRSLPSPPTQMQPGPKAASLEQRFKNLSCAIVSISNVLGNGTGFFVSKDGDIMTAAHVLFSRTYNRQPNGSLGITLALPAQTIVAHDGSAVHVTTGVLTQRDIDLASFDLALVHTNHQTDCFMEMGIADSVAVGQHVLTIGHPALSGSAVLFDGFVSSIHAHLPIPIGYVGISPVMANYQVIRLQMPILAGASGSPVITDGNKVIGIISEVPVVWTADLTELIQRGLAPSGVRIGPFDISMLLAQLALIVHEFESPGSGLAVPISYMHNAPESISRQ